MLLNCGVGEDSWESLGQQRDPTSLSQRKSVLNIHWKVWCWSWSSNTLAIWCEELTYLKRLWCWKRLKVGGEGDDRGWDGWMASPIQRTWVWINSGGWWWTERPGMLQSMRLQRVGHDWGTEPNWTEVLVSQLCLTLCDPIVWVHKHMHIFFQEYRFFLCTTVDPIREVVWGSKRHLALDKKYLGWNLASIV